MEKLLFVFVIPFLISCEAAENTTTEVVQEEVRQQAPAEELKEVPFTSLDPNRASLAFLKGLAGKYPFDANLFETEPMKGRLEDLLAEKYDDFLERMEVQTPIKIENDLAIMQGLKAHSGGTEEAILVVDIPKNLIWVALLKDEKNVIHFNEDGNLQMPLPLFRVIMSWKS